MVRLRETKARVYRSCFLLVLAHLGTILHAQTPSLPSRSTDSAYTAAFPSALFILDAVGCLEPGVPRFLTLADAVQIAQRCNPDLAEAAANVADSRATLAGARSAYYPTVTFNGDTNAGVGATHIYGVPIAQGENTASATAGLEIQWLLYDFGVRKAKLADGAFQLRASIDDERSTTLKVIGDVIQDYFALVSADGQIRVAVAAQRASDETLASLKKKLGEGLALKTEVLQARSDAEKAAVQTMTKRAAFLQQMAELAAKLGLSVDTRFTLPPSVDDSLIADSPQTFSVPELYRALSNLPAVRAAIERRDSAMMQLEAARRAYGGSISASITSNRTSQLHSFVGEAITPHTDLVQLSVSVPLFSGGAREAGIAGAMAALRAADARLRSVAESSVLTAWKTELTLKATRSGVIAARALLDATQAEAARLSAAFRIGDASITDVLQARANEVQAQDAFVQAKADYLSAVAQLQLALGRELK